MAGVRYLPVDSTTAAVRICPDEVSTSQSPAARSMRLTSHPSASVMSCWCTYPVAMLELARDGETGGAGSNDDLQ